MGAHVIKVGLGPVVIDLMERGVITGVAMNGAGIIHDLELAMTGRTSEDVGPALDRRLLRHGRRDHGLPQPGGRPGASRGEGLGRAVGETIRAAGLPPSSRGASWPPGRGSACP